MLSQLCYLNLGLYLTIFFTRLCKANINDLWTQYCAFHVAGVSKSRGLCQPFKFNGKPKFGHLKYNFHSTRGQSQCLVYVLPLWAITDWLTEKNTSNSLVNIFKLTYKAEKHSTEVWYCYNIIPLSWRTKQVLKTVSLSDMTFSLFRFMTPLQNQISLSDTCDLPDYPHQNVSGSVCLTIKLFVCVLFR